MGAEEYGPTKFLENDLVEFALEEMADFANYARYLYVRMRLLQEAALEGGIDLSAGITGGVQQEDELPLGPSTFIPQSEISGFLQEDG